MKSVTFPISRVNRLRRAAERARELPDTDSDPFRPSWVVSASDPANLIGVFDTLQLRAGFALHAYEYRAGGNGNGIIWAVPAEAPLLAPEDCPRLDDVFLHPPKPPRAIALMEVIEGDGTPWSYLSASILWREAAEFGARWHGCMWSDQTILSAAPRQIDDPAALEDAWDELTADPPVGDWTWHRAAPPTWEPTYVESGTTRRVVLHVRNPVGEDVVYRAADIYRADSYDCETETTMVCTGGPGIVY